ncbi:MAG TPA: hypothetical protein VHE12_05935 [bacterium]|nr:hypothetical protein [bacterium]
MSAAADLLELMKTAEKRRELWTGTPTGQTHPGFLSPAVPLPKLTRQWVMGRKARKVFVKAWNEWCERPVLYGEWEGDRARVIDASADLRGKEKA